MQLTDAALEALIEGYAREAGVRSLEKQLGRILRKSVLKLLRNAETPIPIASMPSRTTSANQFLTRKRR